MDTNTCRYSVNIDSNEKCGLHFKNLYELIHHIEEVHIPAIESRKAEELERINELRKNGSKEEYAKALDEFQNQPISMSLFCKLKPFPKGHKVTPIPLKEKTLKFCHYRRKGDPSIINLLKTYSSQIQIHIPPQIESTSVNARVVKQQRKISSSTATQVASKRPPSASITIDQTPPPIKSAKFEQQVEMDTSLKESIPASSGSGTSTSTLAEIKRFRCDVEGCGRAYKNSQGLKLHIKSSHASTTNLSSSVNIIQSAASRLSPFEEGILNRQLPTTVALSNPPNDAVASSTNTITTSEPSVSQSSATIAPADSKTQENSGQEIILITNEEIEEERPLSEPHRQSATKEPVQQSETEAPAVSTNESSVPSAPSPPHPCPPSSSSSFPQQTQQEDFQALPTASASASTTPTSQLASASISSSPTRMLSQTPSIVNKFYCKYCTKVYKTQVNLNKHLHDTHGIAISKFAPASAIQVLPLESNATPIVIGQQPAAYYQQQSSVGDVFTQQTRGRPQGGNFYVYSRAAPVQSQSHHHMGPVGQTGGGQQLISYTLAMPQQQQSSQHQQQQQMEYHQHQSPHHLTIMAEPSAGIAPPPPYQPPRQQQTTIYQNQQQPQTPKQHTYQQQQLGQDAVYNHQQQQSVGGGSISAHQQSPHPQQHYATSQSHQQQVQLGRRSQSRPLTQQQQSSSYSSPQQHQQHQYYHNHNPGDHVGTQQATPYVSVSYQSPPITQSTGPQQHYYATQQPMRIIQSYPQSAEASHSQTQQGQMVAYQTATSRNLSSTEGGGGMADAAQSASGNSGGGGRYAITQQTHGGNLSYEVRQSPATQYIQIQPQTLVYQHQPTASVAMMEQQRYQREQQQHLKK